MRRSNLFRIKRKMCRKNDSTVVNARSQATGFDFSALSFWVTICCGSRMPTWLYFWLISSIKFVWDSGFVRLNFVRCATQLSFVTDWFNGVDFQSVLPFFTTSTNWKRRWEDHLTSVLICADKFWRTPLPTADSIDISMGKKRDYE